MSLLDRKPAVPGYLHTRLWWFLWQFVTPLLGAFLWLFTGHWDIEGETKDGKMFVHGYTCRSLFATLMKELTGVPGGLEPPAHNFRLGDKKVIVTQLQHRNGFLAVIRRYVPDDRIVVLDMDVDADGTGSWGLRNPEACVEDPSEVGLVVVTHLFGVKMDNAWLKRYRDAGAFIIEDAVQGGRFTTWQADPEFHLSFFSAGQDKTPTAMGGGMLTTTERAVGKAIAERVRAYPHETPAQRILFMIKKIPTWLLYDDRWFLWFMLVVAEIVGFTFDGIAQKYRKANSGFDHDNFDRRPSTGLLMGLRDCLANPVGHFESNLVDRRALIRGALSSEARNFFFPWFAGAEPEGDCCVYLHAHVGAQRKHFYSFMQKRGFVIMQQQTWAPFDSERWLPILGRMVLLPNVGGLTTAECEEMADALQTYYDTFGADIKKPGCDSC